MDFEEESRMVYFWVDVQAVTWQVDRMLGSNQLEVENSLERYSLGLYKAGQRMV
jgi:hypothetical protein